MTSLGRQMTEFPLSPGLSMTVIFSASLGSADLVLAVAAMLSVENVFVTPGGKKNLSTATKAHKDLAEQAGGTNDFATLLYVYKQCHSRLVYLQKLCFVYFIICWQREMSKSLHVLVQLPCGFLSGLRGQLISVTYLRRTARSSLDNNRVRMRLDQQQNACC